MTRSDDAGSTGSSPDAEPPTFAVDPRVALSDLLVELAGVLDSERDDRSVSAEIGTALSRLRLPDRDVLTRSAEWIGSVSASSRKQGLDFLRHHGAAMLESFGAGYATTTQRREDQDEEDRFRLVFDNAAVAITICDTQGRIVDANPALAAMLSVPAAELRGQRVSELVHPDDRPTIDVRIFGDLVTVGEGTARIEVRLRRLDDTYSWSQFAVTFVAGKSGTDGYLLAVGEDITERRELENVLYHQSRHDPLTGLANRLLLLETLQRTIGASGPDDRLGLCYVDLDGFKTINDRYGHGTGDRLLAAVADRLRGAVVPGQLIARVGGDEFVSVLPGPVDTTDVIVAARRLLSVVDTPFEIEGRSLQVSASIGVLVPTAHGTDPDALIDAADTALYRAKAHGGGVLVLQDPL